MLTRPKSIDDYGGIVSYLDSTSGQHNGYTGADLAKNWQRGPAFIRDLFGIGGPTRSRNTARDWINRYKRENGIKESD